MSSQTPPSAQESNDLKQADERRRQLNRRAQKAFRERRSEHMAQLEVSMEQMKKDLHMAQQAQSSAKEELLMVKYKNSLLERLLLEHGIDINKELNNPGPAKMRREHHSDAESRRIHKRRRVEQDAPQVMDQGSHTSAHRRPSKYDIPKQSTRPSPNSQTSPMLEVDLMTVLSAVPPPEPDASTPQKHAYSTNSYPSNIVSHHQMEPPLDPLRSNMYPYNSSNRSSSYPSIISEPADEDLLSQTSTTSPDSTRSPPDLSSSHVVGFAYPESGNTIHDKVNKVAFVNDSYTTADELLAFEGLAGDPFGLDDIMNFPCQF